MTLAWLRRPAPMVDRRARAQALGAFLLAGGVVGLVALPLLVQRDVNLGVFAVLAVVTTLAGAVVLAVPGRVPVAVCHLGVAGGLATILTVSVLAGEGPLPVAFGMLLIWVGLYTGYFFAPAAAAAYVAAGLVGYGVLVAARLEQPMALEVLYLTAIVLTSTGVSVWLSQHRGLADEDPVTGAFNRRGFARRLETAMREVDHRGRPLCVALLDVDHFRRVNEARGREGGDRLLAACARRWARLLPDNASLGRLGIDEFGVVLPRTDPGEAAAMLEQLRRAAPEGQTCSAGVVPFSPGDSQSMLMARAETALYDAKRTGRDRVVVLGDDTGTAGELWEAIEGGQLVAHYQPLFSMRTGRLCGVEALVRWQHPERGLIAPGAFLGVAEESGAIHGIDRWVLTEACRQACEWQRLPAMEGMRMAVNVSPSRLRDPAVVADVAEALAASGLAPHLLTLEVTEEALQGDLASASNVLWELRGLGVKLAIDDFGTGHSSLGRLHSLPFDILKIDRSFVSALGGNRGGDSLLAAIVGMARSLELVTVAEGVEDAEQLEALRRHECQNVQGFLLCRPLPAAELSSQLASLRVPGANGDGSGARGEPGAPA